MHLVCSFMVVSAIRDAVDVNRSMHMGQGHLVSRNAFQQANLSCEDIVGFVGGVSKVTASEIYKNDDTIGFVRDSLLFCVGCNSISVIVSEQFDVEHSVAVVHVAEASECEPLSVGVFSADDF